MAVHEFDDFNAVLDEFSCFRLFIFARSDPALVVDLDCHWPLLTLLALLTVFRPLLTLLDIIDSSPARSSLFQAWMLKDRKQQETAKLTVFSETGLRTRAWSPGQVLKLPEWGRESGKLILL